MSLSDGIAWEKEFGGKKMNNNQPVIGKIKLYSENNIKELIQIIAFLKSCVLCGEKLSELEENNINELLTKYQNSK